MAGPSRNLWVVAGKFLYLRHEIPACLVYPRSLRPRAAKKTSPAVERSMLSPERRMVPGHHRPVTL
ncbi:MAG: hypothetical protein VB858_20050 [Planctomycetaceae bacterium]